MSEKKLEYIRGGAIHACATSRLMKTGAWRVFKPVVEMSKCKMCKLCFLLKGTISGQVDFHTSPLILNRILK